MKKDNIENRDRDDSDHDHRHHFNADDHNDYLIKYYYDNNHSAMMIEVNMIILDDNLKSIPDSQSLSIIEL